MNNFFDEDDEDEKVYYQQNLNQELRLLKDVIYDLKRMDFSDEEYRLLDLASVNLNYHPLPPVIGLHIGFRYNDTSYTIDYFDYKIEFSAYVSDYSSGYGSDHHQEHKFLYEIGGHNETIGFFEIFEQNFIHAFKSVGAKNISISNEE